MVQFFEAFDLINCQPAIVVLPAVLRLFGDAQRSASWGDSLSLAQGDLGFTQRGENLVDGVTETWQTTLRSAQPSQRIWTSFKGARSLISTVALSGKVPGPKAIT